jgi:type I restriction enzyme S subunit
MSFPRYPKYKASGVEWLGDVPEEWEVKRLKHNVQLLTEKTDRRNNPLGLENIESWSGRFTETESDFEGEGIAFESGDLLFGKLRPYLAKAYLAKSSGEAVGDLLVMRPKVSCNGRFLQYIILTKEFISIVDGSTFGTKMPRASWEFVGGMLITLPTFPEQTAIAEFLDRETGKIDGLVAEQRRLIELLKEKRQAVISHAVTKGLNPHAPMKPSGIEWLGDVPEHWEVTRLGFLCSKIGSGKTPLGGGEAYLTEGILFIRSQNVYDDGLYLDDVVYVSDATDAEQSWSRVLSGDILLNITGASLGRTCLVPDDFQAANVNQHVCILRLSSLAFRHFVSMVLKSSGMKSQFDAAQNGAAREGLNFAQISKLALALPPEGEQEKKESKV